MTTVQQPVFQPYPESGVSAASAPGGGVPGRQERRIADRRSSATTLDNRETRLHFAAQAAGFGIYDMDCASGEIHWSPELKAIAGLPMADDPITLEKLAALVHPDDRGRLMEAIQASLRPDGSGELEDEHRLLRPDGAVRWVRVKGRTLFTGNDGGRRALAATGVVMDVTESRAYQLELAESRARLAGFIETTTDAILSVDAEQRITMANPAACRMFRCPLEEMVGSSHDRFIPKQFREIHREHIRHFLENGITGRVMGQAGIFLGVRADGEEFPVEASISKVRVGGEWQMTVILRDITERKRIEESLRKSEELMRLANEAANIGTYDTDLESGRARLSPELCDILGLPTCPEMSLEDIIAKLIHPDDRSAMAADCQRSADPGGTGLIRREQRILRPNGEIRWLAWRGRTTFQDSPTGRRPVRNIGACFDITDRKRLEEALQQMNEVLEQRIEERTTAMLIANEELVRSNLELQQFAYIAAHDLQTPLRSISGFAQLLQQEYRGHISSQADIWITQMVHHVERMHELIQDLMAYSGVDSPGRPFESTDFRQIVEQVAASLQSAIQESQATLTCGELPTVMGDRIQLAQVLQNLVANAIKYRSSNVPRIHVSATRQGKEWLFSVSDNGIGIARKHQDRIFEIFRRLHSQQAYPGTGIGLAICRRVVQRHGGRIWVDSEPGRGSTFHFTLPA